VATDWVSTVAWTLRLHGRSVPLADAAPREADGSAEDREMVALSGARIKSDRQRIV